METRATYLLSSMRNGAVGDDVRQMAAVLLRRLISNEFEEFYSKVRVDHDSLLLNLISFNPKMTIICFYCSCHLKTNRN